MKVSFLAQPVQSLGGWAATWFEDSLSDPDAQQLIVATAWAKRSGLLRLGKHLESFRSRGGTSEAIIGIDHGGATRQGLESAVDLFDNAFVYHEPSGRTFHPKVYVVSSDKRASVLIGSNNLTAGGFFSNFEAAAIVDLDLSSSDDQAFYDDIQSWFELLRSDSGTCHELTHELIEQLSSDRKYNIVDEADLNRAHGDAIDDSDRETYDSTTDSVFSRSSLPLQPFAPRLRELLERSTSKADSRVPVDTDIDAGEVPEKDVEPGEPTDTWYKKMSKADAQHPTGERSHPTGNLKLTKAKHNIDKDTYFRNEMFGNVEWSSSTNRHGNRETALVTFDTVIEETHIGDVTLTIDHQESRIANQNNVPTWLHWGQLQTVLKENNYTDAWIILRKLSDGSHTLTITWDDPEFLT